MASPLMVGIIPSLPLLLKGLRQYCASFSRPLGDESLIRQLLHTYIEIQKDMMKKNNQIFLLIDIYELVI